MPDWLIPALLFAVAAATSLVARTWLMRRWLATGMSARRAAAWSVAITWVPLLALAAIGVVVSGRPIEPMHLVIIIVALALPILYGFGLRYAIFDYASKHVREHEHQRWKAARPQDERR